MKPLASFAIDELSSDPFQKPELEGKLASNHNRRFSEFDLHTEGFNLSNVMGNVNQLVGIKGKLHDKRRIADRILNNYLLGAGSKFPKKN